jgi:hypothetical protein
MFHTHQVPAWQPQNDTRGEGLQRPEPKTWGVKELSCLAYTVAVPNTRSLLGACYSIQKTQVSPATNSALNTQHLTLANSCLGHSGCNNNNEAKMVSNNHPALHTLWLCHRDTRSLLQNTQVSPVKSRSALRTQNLTLCCIDHSSCNTVMGVFVTREHVRHNKSGIAHRGRTGINH